MTPDLPAETEVFSRITVVMPCLNTAGFIEQAVHSVLGQAGSLAELIVMDGVSTDGTQDILARLQHRYPRRLRWFSQSDAGPAQALNRAMELVTTDVVGWLNADDLYSSVALQQAIAHLDRHPEHVMVYGLARHVDAHGKSLGAYPTRPPASVLADLVNGSGVCQPSVFFRRAAMQEVGPLDEQLKTAFDYEWWWRWFNTFPGRIGFVRRVWAASRLHPACLTQRLRRTVALEGMAVVARYAGQPPAHWFWTHVDEIMQSFPLSGGSEGLLKTLQSFLKEAARFYPASTMQEMLAQLKRDSRLLLAKEGLLATVEPDGWVAKRVQVRYLNQGAVAKAVLVHCSAMWPVQGRMRLRISSNHGALQYLTLQVPGEFVLRLDVPEPLPGKSKNLQVYAHWLIEAHHGFVPSEHQPDSDDHRRLSFKVMALQTTNEDAAN